MIIRFRTRYVTTADRRRMAARQAAHVDTYGAPRPVVILPFTGRQAADFLAAAFVIIFAVMLVAGYVSDVSARADMCAEVFASATDHIPAECVPLSTRN